MTITEAHDRKKSDKKNNSWLATYLFQRIIKLEGGTIVFVSYEKQNVITNINTKLPSKLKKR